jgi:hypothetical protein
MRGNVLKLGPKTNVVSLISNLVRLFNDDVLTAVVISR